MDVIIDMGHDDARPLGVSAPYNFDLDLGDKNDFELSMDYSAWLELSSDYKEYMDGWLNGTSIPVYVPDEEYGGYISEIEAATNTEKVYLRGYTWRGILANVIIKPPDGQDYLKMSGKLEDIVFSLINTQPTGGWYSVDVVRDGTTPTVTNFKFDRYCTLLDGIEKLLASKGYKLELRHGEDGSHYGYVNGEYNRIFDYATPNFTIKCVPALNYGSDVEISQDAKMDFVSKDSRRGCNHLVCLGSGELKDRIVVNLYVFNGEILVDPEIPALSGPEVARVYDNTIADRDDLIEYGTEYLKGLMNFKSFTAKAKYIDNINLGIGDTITGRDLITGTVVTKPIKQKIVKISDGIATVNYVL